MSGATCAIFIMTSTTEITNTSSTPQLGPKTGFNKCLLRGDQTYPARPGSLGQPEASSFGGTTSRQRQLCRSDRDRVLFYFGHSTRELTSAIREMRLEEHGPAALIRTADSDQVARLIECRVRVQMMRPYYTVFSNIAASGVSIGQLSAYRLSYSSFWGWSRRMAFNNETWTSMPLSQRKMAIMNDTLPGTIHR